MTTNNNVATTALGEKLKFETASLKAVRSGGIRHWLFEAYVRNASDTDVYLTCAYLLEADGITLIDKEPSDDND